MKKLTIISVILFAFAWNTHAQKPVNWTEKQLMEPSQLAAAITSNTDSAVIISVGPGAVIPNSIPMGMASTQDGLEKLKTQLKGVDRDKRIVIYCGCCPFEHCPNVRPAIDVLKEMNFTNYYLLDLPHNIKADWIDKGYPVKQD